MTRAGDHSESADDRRLNHLLRRADWRFLLPAGPPRRVVCLTDGDLAEAARAIARPVHDGEAEGADLAVVADAAGTTLAAAFRAVRPQGACYGEWHGLRIGPAGVRRRLERAGFTRVALYWRWPASPGRSPRYWLPLESRASLARFLDQHADARTALARRVRHITVLAWSLALRAHLLRPICAVALKPGGDTPSRGLVAAVRDRSEASGLGAAPEDLSLLLFSPGASPLNKVLGFVLRGRQAEPSLVLKLGRVPAAERALANEAATLRALADEGSPRASGVPSVVFFQEHGPTVLAERFVDGRRLLALLNHERYPDLALKVTHWLCDLASARAPDMAGAGPRHIVRKSLESVVGTMSSVLDTSEVELLRARLHPLADLPIVPEQRDCSPWNIFLTRDDQVMVLDWESSTPHGVPYLDLAYFLAYSAFLLDDALEPPTLLASYRASVDARTPTGSVTERCTRIYLARLGLDASLVPALRTLTWAVHLGAARERLRPAQARRTPFLALLREEMRSA